MRYRKLLVLVAVTTTLGIGHHVDHIIRSNHVGWPVSEEITPFTFSLGFYVLIIPGVVMAIAGHAGVRFWTILAVIGFLFVGLTHFGPLTQEPSEDIVGAYDSAIAGWVAIGILVGFLTALSTTAIYSALHWKRSSARRSAGASS